MNGNRIWFIVLMLVVAGLAGSVDKVYALGETITRFSVGGGGETVSSSNFELRASVGQPIAQVVSGSSSESSRLCVGFECGEGASPQSTPEPTETSTSEPTETSTSEPTETSTSEPTETSTSTPEPTETSTPEPTETPPPGTGSSSDVVINEVYYLGNQGEDWIELKNIGNGTVDITNWWFCARFSYKQLSDGMEILQGDTILGPGEIVVLRSWTDLDPTPNDPNPSSRGSDLGLYKDDNGGRPSFDNGDFLVDFVQWGTAEDVGRSDVAAGKGIWPEISNGQYDFIPTAPEGQSLALSSSNDGTAATDFRNGSQTQGQNNSSSSSGSKKLHLPITAGYD